ncbi:endonuclease V [Tenacibaculum sp.]|nr:endonuclease V [Tenacibaculum sp.]
MKKITYKSVKRTEVVNLYPTGGSDESPLLIDGNLFSGIEIKRKEKNGIIRIEKKIYIKGNVELDISTCEDGRILCFNVCTGYINNGLELRYDGTVYAKCQVFDMGESIEFGELNIYNNEMMKNEWGGRGLWPLDAEIYTGDRNILPYYNLQNEIRERTIKEDTFNKTNIRFIAGIDVGYDELDLKMVIAIVIYDSKEKIIIESQIESQDILFNYCNDLFSYREVPLLKEAFDKLKTKPDLLICKSHGIAHPRYVGLATHLGVELNIPSIGCARDRILGTYNDLALDSNQFQNLIWRGDIVGRAYRILSEQKPIFISIGHKVGLDTACNWVYELQKINIEKNILLPYPLIEAERLVNSNLEERTHIEFIQTKV